MRIEEGCPGSSVYSSPAALLTSLHPPISTSSFSELILRPDVGKGMELGGGLGSPVTEFQPHHLYMLLLDQSGQMLREEVGAVLAAVYLHQRDNLASDLLL